jgi:hypothetical protein
MSVSVRVHAHALLLLRDARKRRVAECRRINASGGRWRWVGATTLQELMPNGRWVVVEPAAAPLPLLPPVDAAS